MSLNKNYAIVQTIQVYGRIAQNASVVGTPTGFFFAAFFPEANEEIQHDHGFRDCANASLLSGVVNDGLHAAFDVALRRGG